MVFLCIPFLFSLFFPFCLLIFCFTLCKLIHLFSVFMPFLWADVFIFFSEGNAFFFAVSGRIQSILWLWIFFLPFLFHTLCFFFSSALLFYLSFPSSVPSLIHSFRLCNAGRYYKCHLLPITVQKSKILFRVYFSLTFFLPTTLLTGQKAAIIFTDLPVLCPLAVCFSRYL